MNAVNLIPADSRKRRSAPGTSLPTLALFAGLMVVLVAAVLYVTAANNVTSKRSELARVTAAAASWHAVASSYAPYMQSAQQRTQELADVRQLAASRYPWEEFLSQVGSLMPAKAALSSLTATTTPGGSGTTATTTSSTASAASTAASSQPPVPSVQLDGCAASQSTVAQTMLALHRIHGVSAVTLASASSAQSGGSGAGVGSGGCPFPVSFQVSLTFAAVPAASSTGSTASLSTPSTASAATPTASAATSSTGGQAQ